MREIVLNANMGSAILARLQDFAPLPASGYIAGQAVASAVSELFGDGRAVVYNDVDVFRKQTDQEWNSFLEMRESRRGAGENRRAIDTTLFTTVEIEEEYSRPVAKSVDRYRVVQTRRHGLLNEIVCQFHDSTAQQFLSTFDMNCVQVAVDLESQKLVWTPQFERFNRTRELDIVTLHTPFHSLIRYFKKRQELEGVTGNDRRILEMLAAAYYMDMRAVFFAERDTPREYSNLRWRFGQGYREKLAPVAGLVLPHFSIETETIRDYDVTFLRPRFELDSDFQPSMCDLSIVHGLPKYSRALREKHSKGTQRMVDYVLPKIEQPSPVVEHWLAYGDDFLQSDADVTKVTAMEAVAEKKYLGLHLSAPTLDGMLARFEAVCSEASKRGRWVYPALAQKEGRAVTEGTLTQYLDEQEALLHRKQKKPTLPAIELNGYSCHELCTAMEAALELPRYGQSAYVTLTPDRNVRDIVFAQDGHPRLNFLVRLYRNALQPNWRVISVARKGGRKCSTKEIELAKSYAAYANLALFTGTYPAAALAGRWPRQAQVLGDWLDNTLLKTLAERRAHRLPFPVSLARRLQLDERVFIGKVMYTPKNAKYWSESLKLKLMKSFRPQQFALFEQERKLSEEIPF